jgi:hypothetical protein
MTSSDYPNSEFQAPPHHVPVLDAIDRLVEALLQNSLDPPVVKVMTRKTAITYFKEKAPLVIGLKKGIMYRQIHPDGSYLFVQAFLNEQNQLLENSNHEPYGQILYVKAMDNELITLFGDKDLIIVN